MEQWQVSTGPSDSGINRIVFADDPMEAATTAFSLEFDERGHILFGKLTRVRKATLAGNPEPHDDDLYMDTRVIIEKVEGKEMTIN